MFTFFQLKFVGPIVAVGGNLLMGNLKLAPNLWDQEVFLPVGKDLMIAWFHVDCVAGCIRIKG